MEMISMSRKERKRLEAFSRVKGGDMTLVEASELLGLSYRQTKRAWSRYQSEGDASLAHRLRGRSPNRHSPEETKLQSLALYREQYADYGATLAAECLEKEDGVKVSVTTLRRWLLQAGLLERRRKRRAHRRRRTRREHLGDLLQMDGSHHDWFEGRRGWAVLMVMIDDATGIVPCVLLALYQIGYCAMTSLRSQILDFYDVTSRRTRHGRSIAVLLSEFQVPRLWQTWGRKPFSM